LFYPVDAHEAVTDGVGFDYESRFTATTRGPAGSGRA